MKAFPKKFSSEAFNEEGLPYSDVYDADEVDKWLEELRDALRNMSSDQTVVQHGDEARMIRKIIDRSLLAGREVEAQ
jgi:hypothetical protein